MMDVPWWTEALTTVAAGVLLLPLWLPVERWLRRGVVAAARRVAPECWWS